MHTQLRMREAAHQLKQGQDGLAAIASRVGYTSEFAFNRAFRRVMGVPPGEYRRKAPQAGEEEASVAPEAAAKEELKKERTPRVDQAGFEP
jgi:AraC-like DNA-binding protein